MRGGPLELDERVGAMIRALISQMESWLIGILPVRDAFDNPKEDQGVVFPTLMPSWPQCGTCYIKMFTA